MTDRDHFAAAALTGLLARPDVDADPLEHHYCCEDAYRWADAMLRCRAGGDCPGQDNAPNLDASPEATASVESVAPQPTTRGDSDRTDKAAPRPSEGTGDTPATHATPGEGSEQRECTEPVAWAVMVGGERMYVSWCKEMCEDEAYYHRHPCGDSVSVVPLYRQPQPTLTDAERSLLEMLADHPVTHEIMPNEVATLWGLLERLGGAK